MKAAAFEKSMKRERERGGCDVEKNPMVQASKKEQSIEIKKKQEDVLSNQMLDLFDSACGVKFSVTGQKMEGGRRGMCYS